MSETKADYPTRDISLVGAAGVHAVVSELSLRGLIALPTIRNTAGVDVIVAQGSEAGGHVGSVTAMVLIPHVVDVIRQPVLAAGGIADGRGVAAALMLGVVPMAVSRRRASRRE